MTIFQKENEILKRRIPAFLGLLLLFILLGSSTISSGQTIKIYDQKNGQALIGATVKSFDLNQQSSVVLSTNKKGEVTIPSSVFKNGNQVLVQISYIGYQSKSDSISLGQTKTFELKSIDSEIDEVVITAQYSPTSIENSVHNVKVISRQKIESMAAVNLRDVLTNELNIRLSQDNILGAGMSMQGIDGQNVKIMIDGVPVVGRLDGQIDLNQINLNDVERIEIVEGPLSVNYGSNALAGTINIITKKTSTKRLSAGITSYNENVGTYNLMGTASFKIKKSHFINTSFGRNYFDGWSPRDKALPSFEDQLADSSRVQQWNPKEQYFARLQYSYQLKDLLLTYKGEILNEEITNLGAPRRTRTSFVAFDDYYHTDRIDNALFASGKLNDKLNLNFTAARNDFRRIKEARRKDLVSLESNLVPEAPNNDQQDTSNFNLLMSRASINTTFDSSWVNFELGYDINYESASGERIEGGERYQGDYALFSSAEIKLSDYAIFKPSVRYAYNTQYDAPITPALNLKLNRANSSIRLSYASGFRAPSLKELYFNFDDVNHSLFGNPDLKAERSNNYSASLHHKVLINNYLVKLELRGFYNQIYDQITFAQSGLSGDSLIYFNVGKNETQGLNMRTNVILENLSINLGASYIGRLNQLSEEESSVAKFSYATELVANTTYRLSKPKLNISLFYKYQGELPGFVYDENDEVVERTISPFSLLDATLSKQFWEDKITLGIGCKNILDVQNVDASLNAGGAHSGGGSIAVGTGRTYFLKLNIQIDKN